MRKEQKRKPSRENSFSLTREKENRVKHLFEFIGNSKLGEKGEKNAHRFIVAVVDYFWCVCTSKLFVGLHGVGAYIM